MSKTNTMFLHSSVEPPCADRANLYLRDKRLPHLLVVLRQLDEFVLALGALPEHELSEVISAALRVCGFVEPMEAHQVIAAVLDALEVNNSFREKLPFSAYGGRPS
ncbi:MAG: hypothetical protein WB660_16345 [Candidatus Sulfotelmatobacter sp.]